MELKRIEPLSAGKIMALMYFVTGIFVGIMYALYFGITGAAIGGSLGSSEGAALFGIFGAIGALIVTPLIYALMGFVGGLLGAVIYNFAAGKMGGIKMEFK